MMTGGMITDANSTPGVEASQETLQEMCEGIVKEVGTAIYKETIPAKATRMITGFVVSATTCNLIDSTRASGF